MATRANQGPPFSVRVAPQTYRLFDDIVRQLNEQLPHGRISRGAALDLVVSSAHATLAAEGRLRPGQETPRRKDKPG